MKHQRSVWVIFLIRQSHHKVICSLFSWSRWPSAADEADIETLPDWEAVSDVPCGGQTLFVGLRPLSAALPPVNSHSALYHNWSQLCLNKYQTQWKCYEIEQIFNIQNQPNCDHPLANYPVSPILCLHSGLCSTGVWSVNISAVKEF